MRKSRLLIVGLIGTMMLNMTACGLQINGKQVFGGSKKTTETGEVSNISQNKSENSNASHGGKGKSLDETDVDGRKALDTALSLLEEDDYIYSLETFTNNKETITDDIDSLMIESYAFVNNNKKESLVVSTLTGSVGNEEVASDSTITLYNIENEQWLGKTVSSSSNNVKTSQVGDGDKTFSEVVFSQIKSDELKVNNTNISGGKTLIIEASDNEFSYEIAIDNITNKFLYIDSDDIKTGGDSVYNNYTFIYKDADKFNSIYENMKQETAKVSSMLDVSDIFNKDENKVLTNDTLSSDSKQVDGTQLLKQAFRDFDTSKYLMDLEVSMSNDESGEVLNANVYGIADARNNSSLYFVTGKVLGGEAKAIQYAYVENGVSIVEEAKYDLVDVKKETNKTSEFDLATMLAELEAQGFKADNTAYKLGDDWEIEVQTNDSGYFSAILDNSNRLVGFNSNVEANGSKVSMNFSVDYVGTEGFELEYGNFIRELNNHNKALDITEYINNFADSKYAKLENNIETQRETESYNRNVEETKKQTEETYSNSLQSENVTEAEQEIAGYLGKQVREFRFEHCSYDFAEVGVNYRPGEKVKIKLTYTNFANGNMEKLYKTLTLENKTNEEQVITGMTVISID